MSGTKAGGEHARATNYERHGENHYKKIGALGGALKNPLKGFGTRRDLASSAGTLGGSIGKGSYKKKLTGKTMDSIKLEQS